MKIALCEIDSIDEFIFAYIKKHIDKITILKFKTKYSLLSYLYEKKDIDIIIFDFKPEKKLTFILISDMTAYQSELCYSNIILNLMKPIDYQKFSTQLDYAIHILHKNINKEYCIEKNDSGLYKIFFKDISYIETCARKTLIHVNNFSFTSYRSMKLHETNLDKRFFRCHSGYIVNMEYIKAIQYPDIELITGDILPLSKDRRKKFMNSYKTFYKDYI